ncbi:FGGY-family carbohydrate kinase [Limobrevibacterium gyesilva]|uniref:FGGY-family carbohydrate kinase n=1 Tax=Limobrevibacterium gyesilva TaxID=2991712 RepID=A0AA42CFL5_9PROT|nr:FGGY-family carbohydrate kinase [Limobrevibacterium gyesilva]MCW3476779.1 FGGY-family carbohydrate kinase [Limobrevibacterium gyesilva]
MTALLLAVDVGTAAARAGLFDPAGRVLGTASQELSLLRPHEDHAVYRMDSVWNAVCAAIHACLESVPGAGQQVVGLAFDATASLVLGHDGAAPLEGGADVFCWMDHRAEAEAHEITRTGDGWLAHMGGVLSPENHLPKLLWLKRRAPAAWARVTGVRDLCDELARRATGVDAHSLCPRAAKWPYLPKDETNGGWRYRLLERLGLEAVWTMGAMSDPPVPVGQAHGTLSPDVAAFLGLTAGIPVAAGLIDAEAGMLGVLGRGIAGRADSTLALIGGTSTCFMAVTAQRRMIPGIWGPFYGAVLPDMWLHEGGQSCTGAALDALLAHHPGGPRLATPETHEDTAAEILDLLDRVGPGFAARRHIVPDWLGNRSPLGDGSLRALVTGQGEDIGYGAFLETYYATARALVLQARQIIAHMNGHGYAINRVALSGGHARNRLLVRLYRDALGCDLTLSRTAEPVLLGTAMVAAVAAGVQPDLFVALDRMAPSQMRSQADPRWKAAHGVAYGIYLKLFEARNEAAAAALALEGLAGASKGAA